MDFIIPDPLRIEGGPPLEFRRALVTQPRVKAMRVVHGRYTRRRIAAKEDPYSVMEPTGKQPGTIAREDAGPARTSSARR